MAETKTADFDVAVSFAGENRWFVEEVVQQIKDAGFQVFYDEDQKYEMWGQELTEYFPDIYERRSRFVVMFISKDYASKPWTTLERRSVLLRAMNEKSPYLLPVRLDSTELPGVRSTIAYLEGLREGPDGVAKGILHKLGEPAASGTRKFNGLVPRTQQEIAVLLGERPPAWEYLLFSALLVSAVDDFQSKYEDHRLEFTLPQTYVPADDVPDVVRRELSRIMATTSVFERLLLGPAQQDAMGKPGESGDPDRIEQLALRLGSVYEEMLNWAASLRSCHTTPEGSRLLLAVSKYATQPIEEVKAFTRRYRDLADGLTDKLSRGESVAATFSIHFEIPDEVQAEYDEAFAAFRNSL